MGVLASLDWSGPARQLLKSTSELESGKPAVMHIRHTARATATREEAQRNPNFDARSLLSTPEGEQATIDFGSSLPKDRVYVLYHTDVERVRETADGIRRGIMEAGGRVKMTDVIAYEVMYNPEANMR